MVDHEMQPEAARVPAEAAPARIRPLAVLPLFVTLTGRRVVVIGGSEGAAWKAELLAAAGADVLVVADAMSDEMRRLAARPLDAGSLTLIERDWQPSDCVGAALVVADVEEEDCAAVAEAARAAGAILNVVDKPEYGDVQFGTVVNRSPVVVGISTAGVAPILGQAVRRRIETLLPPSLAAWGALAGRLRATIMARFPAGQPRRRIWERLAARAFGPAPGAADETAVLAPLDDAMRTGRVTLVGAGPGDAELLTLKAVRALQSADVILFDDLVSDEVLELARREARRMLVGKRARRPSCRQEDINGTMLSLARAGRHVVRLKSGDPMVFGRAGEEIAALREAGIPVEIVPGVTAALAMAASLGVSLTHRDHARSVRFVTGHGRNGELPADLDWRALADPVATTIVYMGSAYGPALAARLIAEGLGGHTPVALARALSLPEEARAVTTLESLAAGAAPVLPGDGPILIGIGAVFGDAATVAVGTRPAQALAGR